MRAALLAVLLLLMGCHRYETEAAKSDYRVWRLDRWTGEVCMFTKTNLDANALLLRDKPDPDDLNARQARLRARGSARISCAK